MTTQPSGDKKRRVKRRKPRKKALNTAQAQAQLTRYDALLNKWVQELGVVAKKIEQYRKKVMYYQKRVAELTAAEMAALEQATLAIENEGTRSLRAIESE